MLLLELLQRVVSFNELCSLLVVLVIVEGLLPSAFKKILLEVSQRSLRDKTLAFLTVGNAVWISVDGVVGMKSRIQ